MHIWQVIFYLKNFKKIYSAWSRDTFLTIRVLMPELELESEIMCSVF